MMGLPKPIARPDERIIFGLKSGRRVRGLVRRQFAKNNMTSKIPHSAELFVVRYEDERRIDRYAIVQISVNRPHKCVLDSLVSVFEIEDGVADAIAVDNANLVQLCLNEHADIIWKENWTRNNQ